MAGRPAPQSGAKPKPRGSGALGGKQSGDANPSIRARRRASHPDKIREKREQGLPAPSRGFVRLGVLNTRIMTGEEDLSTWSDEELRRGQKKDKNGRWVGRAPSVVPKALHDEMVKRTLAEAGALIRDALVPACKLLKEVIDDPDAEDKDRIKAASMILDRVMGKAPEIVHVDDGRTAPWQEAIAASVVSLPETILETTATEDDEEGD